MRQTLRKKNGIPCLWSLYRNSLVSVSALVFLRHPTSRTISIRSVSKFSRIAPFKSGSGGQGAGKSTFFRLLAIKDEWFSDDLKKLDDDKVFTKLQGHFLQNVYFRIFRADHHRQEPPVPGTVKGQEVQPV